MTEHLKGRKLIAVSARAGKPKQTSRIVVIAKASGQLAAGKSVTVKLSLNSTGRALLAKYRRLHTMVTIKVGSAVIAHEAVTITAPATKYSKHKKK